MPTVFLVDPAPPGDGPLYRLFHGAGYHVVQLATGEEARAAMVVLRPDLLIVDAAVPAAGAAALAARLRAEPRGNIVPLILLNVRPDDRRLRGLVEAEDVFADGASVPKDLLDRAARYLTRAIPAPPHPPAPPFTSAN